MGKGAAVVIIVVALSFVSFSPKNAAGVKVVVVGVLPVILFVCGQESISWTFVASSDDDDDDDLVVGLLTLTLVG